MLVRLVAMAVVFVTLLVARPALAICLALLAAVLAVPLLRGLWNLQRFLADRRYGHPDQLLDVAKKRPLVMRAK